MEFNEKLQSLRKQKGLTQEELAQALYVSRTAISKWESGRGYPSIDSLKVLAAFFGVTIDELLTGKEAINLAEADSKQREQALRRRAFALLDCSAILFLLLPLFNQLQDDGALAVSLLAITGMQPYIKAACLALVALLTLFGIGSLAAKQRCVFLQQHQERLSLALQGGEVLLFILCQQTYAAAFAFMFLAIKALMLLRQR